VEVIDNNKQLTLPWYGIDYDRKKLIKCLCQRH